MDCSETLTCHIREEATPYSVSFSKSKEILKKEEEKASNVQDKNNSILFHICVSFCWFFSEEGLTSCYKNIFIFTIVELQDKSSVRNKAPAKVRLQCHSNSTSPSSLSLSVSVPVSRCCSPTSSNK